MVVAFEDDFFVGLSADESERSGTDGMPRHFISATVRHNADRSIGEIPKQGRIRFLHVKDHGEVIGRVDTIDEAVDRGFSAANFALNEGVEGALHIARGEWASVMKRYAMVQVEDVGEGIGNFPTLG